MELSSEEILRAPAPDVVLIAAPRHGIDVVPASSFPALIGIGTLGIELDFKVA
jgi:hypothetical protein